MRFQSILRHLVFCLLVCFTQPASAQTLELSLEDGRVAAREAVLRGQFGLAREFADALRQADPDDRVALIVLAAVQPQLGAPREGRRAGVRAFRLSQSADERYEAARLVALAAANEERYTLSQIWLRRAAVNAPDDDALRQTRSDYRSIRNLNPWAVQLAFSVTPSSNVNGGSSTDCLFSIPSPEPGGDSFCAAVFSGAAQALSGITASADLRFSYAFSRSAQQRTSLIGRTYARAVWLSQDAREIAPSSQNSDFASQIVEVGLRHQRRLGEGSVTAEALHGWSWFGGDLGSKYRRATLSYDAPLSARTGLGVTGEIQFTDIDGVTSQRTNRTDTLSVGLTHLTESSNRIAARLTYRTQNSDSINEQFDTLTAQINYAWAEPVATLQMSAAAGAEWADYPRYTLPFQMPGRQDTRVFANVTAVLTEMDYAGFVPVVTLGVQDTQSNVARFQRQEFSLNIGLRSSF